MFLFDLFCHALVNFAHRPLDSSSCMCVDFLFLSTIFLLVGTGQMWHSASKYRSSSSNCQLLFILLLILSCVCVCLSVDFFHYRATRNGPAPNSDHNTHTEITFIFFYFSNGRRMNLTLWR